MRRLFEICVLGPTLLVAGSPLARRQTTNAKFSLFAYGDNIGGFPVQYLNGLAFIAEDSVFNSSFQSPSFTQSSTMLVANPNTTFSSNATWGQQLLALPPAGSNGQVSFVSNTSSDVITSGFSWYGGVAFLTAPSGELQSLFFAQSTGTDGLWELGWNLTTADDSVVPVTLKNAPPPTA